MFTIYKARAQPLFCSLNLLFGRVLRRLLEVPRNTICPKARNQSEYLTKFSQRAITKTKKKKIIMKQINDILYIILCTY